jgi:trimethylamine--corrinoid protein Co-methyltransferase
LRLFLQDRVARPHSTLKLLAQELFAEFLKPQPAQSPCKISVREIFISGYFCVTGKERKQRFHMETALRVLSDHEIDQVQERTLSLLATTGIRVDTERGRKILKDAGADVDQNTSIVRFPRSMIEECLQLAPHSFTLGGRRPDWKFTVNNNECTLLADGAAVHIIDSQTGDRRPPTYDDWLEATRLIDALDEVGVYWSMVEPTFFQKTTADFILYWRKMITNFSKHLQDCTYTVEQSRWMLEVLGTVFGTKEEIRALRPFSFLLTPVSPLVIEADHTDAFLEILDWGIPAAIMPMPMMGGTAPASLISTILLANCETLAMLCLVQAASPGTPTIYAAAPAIMDPLTGRFTGSEVEHGLLGAAVTEMARAYGLPVEASTGGSGHYTPGIRSSYERALNWAISSLSWPDLLVGPGQLGGSMILSLEQLMIDVEIFRRCDRLSDGIDTGLDEWLEVDLAAVGHGGNFLGRRSTRDALNAGEVYVSDFDTRDSFEVWSASGRPSLLDDVQDLIKETLDSHEILPLEEDVQLELAKIEERARKSAGAPKG